MVAQQNEIAANGLADLHVHTNYSDGVLSPEEVINKAIEIGLKAIAITDHDCVDGVLPSVRASEGQDIEVIPGIEMSASQDGTEIHILGYFVDPENSDLKELLGEMRSNRVKRMQKTLDLLREQGIDISEEKIFADSIKGTLGRLHLARILVEVGSVRDTKEAFDRFLGDGKSCHVKHKRLDASRAIAVIRSAGGVPVLAHPGTLGKDEYIEYYVKVGLKGIEVFHSKHRPTANKRYTRFAQKHDLVMTGGSDCHGVPYYGGELMMGKVTVDCEVVEALRKESEKIKKEKK